MCGFFHLALPQKGGTAGYGAVEHGNEVFFVPPFQAFTWFVLIP